MALFKIAHLFRRLRPLEMVLAQQVFHKSLPPINTIGITDGLGAVEIHRELMTAAARWMAALKLESVLSARIAIRLNSFSLPKKFSIR